MTIASVFCIDDTPDTSNTIGPSRESVLDWLSVRPPQKTNSR